MELTSIQRPAAGGVMKINSKLIQKPNCRQNKCMVGRVAVRDRPCFCPLAVPTSFSYHFSPSNLDSARNNICFGDFATPEQNRVVYLYVYICICLFVYLCRLVFVYWYICIFVYFFTCLLIYLSICIFVYLNLYICMFVFVNLCFCIRVFIFVSLCLCL